MTRTFSMAVKIILTLCTFLASDAQAHPAWGIAVDHQEQVYFSDLKTVWKIDAQGKLSVLKTGVDTHTHDLNIDEDGNLYGTDNSYDPQTQRFFSAVWKKTPTNGFSYLLAPTDNPTKGISIWKDRDGNMFHVTRYPADELLVLKRTPDGLISALVGSRRAAREYRQSMPYSIGGMSFGADGSLYFTHGANVSKVTMSGTVIPLARNIVVENTSGKPAEGSPLFGIVVDAQGSVFVADYGNRRVLKIAVDGKRSTVIRSEDPWFPTGVAIKGSGLYILEEGHTPTHKPIGSRVRKLAPDGTVTVLATVGEGNVSPGRKFSAGATLFGVSSERISESEQSISNVPIRMGIGILLLTIFVWLARRKIYHLQL